MSADVAGHKAEALRLLDWLEDPTKTSPRPDPRVPAVLSAALVRSNLAIAEGQERVAEELQGIRRTLVAMHTNAPIDAVAASEEALDAQLGAKP